MCDRPNCFVDGGFAGQQALVPGFGLDPLESAISNAASSASGADGMTLLILQDHLKKLCKLQRDNFSSSPTTRFEVHVSDALSVTGDPATATNLKTTGCEIKPGR